MKCVIWAKILVVFVVRQFILWFHPNSHCCLLQTDAHSNEHLIKWEIAFNKLKQTLKQDVKVIVKMERE
jgi:hypothetical protein